MEAKTLGLALGMLLTGTINTIATKYQLRCTVASYNRGGQQDEAAVIDLVVVGSSHGEPRYFQHPAVQSAMMFLGELLCLIPYTISYVATRAREGKHVTVGIQERRRQAHSWKAIFAFAIPALCDACGTTLINVGLFFTYASAYQMLRGTLVFFCGLFTLSILRRRLHIHHWLGMVLIVAGAALVGLASLITVDFDPDPYPDEEPYEANGLVAYKALQNLVFMGRRGLKAIAQGLPQGPTPFQGSAAAPDPGASRPLLGNLLVVGAQVATALQFIIEERSLTQYRVPALLAVGLEGFWGLLLCCIICPVLTKVELHGRPVDSFPNALKEIAAQPVLLWSTIVSIISIAFFNSFGVKVTKRLSGAARAAIDACRTLFIWGVALCLGWEPTQPPLRIALQVVGFVVLVSGTSLYNELLRSCLPAPTMQASPSLQDALAEVGQYRPPHSTARAARPRVIRDDTYSMARSMRVPPQALSPHSLSSVRFSRMFGPLTRAESSAANMQYGQSPGRESYSVAGSVSTHVSWLTRAPDDSVHDAGYLSNQVNMEGVDAGALSEPLLGRGHRQQAATGTEQQPR